jgi:diguanylate cyclase (GGDEF)-like protein
LICFPKLIEYNGQIRAKASGVTHSGLNDEQEAHIKMQLHKIEERLAEIAFNHKLVCANGAYPHIEKVYKKMLTAQDEIITVVKQRVLNNAANQIGGIAIFDAITASMESMIALQRVNLGTLKTYLSERFEQKRSLLKATLFIGFGALFFIVYMNYLFYKENKKLIETVEKMSMSDGLTKLHNRRAFDMVFDRYLSFIQREKKSLVFMLIDIDFFKQYNDTYGHQAGDEALHKVAQCLQKNLKRDSDEVFRLGGEEFGVLALDMDASNAYNFAENLRKNIEGLEIEHKHNKASKHLTISVGVHIVGYDDKTDKTSCYTKADEALYRSKEEGRNRVSIN